MATETRDIPQIAKSAIGLFLQNQQQAVNELGVQVRSVMGLDDSWKIDFQKGVAVHEDAAPKDPQVVGEIAPVPSA